MELNKTHSVSVPLLKRTDVTYRVAFDGPTPNRLKLVEAIHKKEKGMVVVASIQPRSGEQVVIVTARVYADEAIANEVEQEKMLAKQKPKVAKVEE